MDIRKLLTATSLVALSISTANAALVGRLAATEGGTDYQAYYDTEADLTWLADANAAIGSMYDTYSPGTGYMNWVDANAWAASLDVDGVTGWRLPDSEPTCGLAYNCAGSEMGNLFYNVLGNTAGFLTNAGPFSNIHSGLYWSATDYALVTDLAWGFGMGDGYQDPSFKTYNNHAWAVHSGDVSAVPIPPSVFLFGSGLIGLIGFVRRKADA